MANHPAHPETILALIIIMLAGGVVSMTFGVINFTAASVSPASWNCTNTTAYEFWDSRNQLICITDNVLPSNCTLSDISAAGCPTSQVDYYQRGNSIGLIVLGVVLLLVVIIFSVWLAVIYLNRRLEVHSGPSV